MSPSTIAPLKVWELECYYRERGFDLEKYDIISKYIKEWTWIDKDWVRLC